ncbi:hypothetical protein RND71_039210 [Anisodus tanguticus]|uniref:Uncharacterized protein n=1 Tax=Anisodus tanguticus TaxID=243964 RepID=A0AAE1QVI0_9SOLA|nr:hypothetical protein RND71_039210 [Anisodus tanguticus]
MGHMGGYNRIIGRRCYGIRGIKLNSRKFSVQKLRVKFFYFFKILRKSLKFSCGNLLSLLNKNVSARKHKDENLVKKKVDYGMYGNSRSDYKLKSYTCSNSFYAEAIADCLDFIKRNSLSIEEKPVLCHET